MLQVTFENEWEVIYGTFEWHIYVWPLPIWKVKVGHIWAMNILEILIDRVKNTIAIMYGLSIGIFAFDFGPF